MKPTIVLVHGAFAESSSWDGVIDSLLDAGHPVIAASNPLRGLASDAAAVADVVRAVDGPVVLAAHSYGGAVISNVPADAGEIVGLVYACGFAPEPGEHQTAFRAAAGDPLQHDLERVDLAVPPGQLRWPLPGAGGERVAHRIHASDGIGESRRNRRSGY